MALIDDIREDIKEITSDEDGFAVEHIFTAPTGQTATVNALHTKHHLGFHPDSGAHVNKKNAHSSVSESLLVAAGYPVRKADGKVHLANHQVQVKDSTGTLCRYVVAEWIPDETLGVILLILGDKI